MECYNCRNNDLKREYSFHEFQLYTCRQCNLSKIYPSPSQDVLSKYYSGTENNIAKGNTENEILAFKSNPLQVIKILFKTRFAPLTGIKEVDEVFKNKNESVIMDVGCGGGVFLASLSYLDHKNLYGIEYNKESVELIKKHFKYNITRSEIKVQEHYPKADIVTCFDVIEHLTEPAGAAKELNRMLKDGRYLHIRVPNYGSLVSRILRSKWLWTIPPFHLNYFTKQSLENIFSMNGFEVLKLYTSSSGYRLAFITLQVKKIFRNDVNIATPHSRSFSDFEFFLINIAEVIFKIIYSPVILFQKIFDMDDCITLVAKKTKAV